MVGRVLDPEGKPVPGATIVAYAQSWARECSIGREKGPDPDR